MNTKSTLRELSASQPVPHVLDHEMLRCIGRGSYGEVWLARNAFGTCRAVKVVFRDNFEDARPYEREYSGIRRYEPVSRSHAGLVDILQVGRNDSQGYFYYVMELADDAACAAPCAPGAQVRTDTYAPRTLSSEKRRHGRIPARECVALGASLSSALAELHGHGLIHRDIKPSNIIFVGGVAKFADIGLVSEASESQSYVGTEGFIPPEGPNSPQADIFSLGKVLYEIAMAKDRLDFPEPATALEDLPDRDLLVELNTILLKACQPARERRYASALEMHAELQLLQRGESILAKRRTQRRLQWMVTLGACVGLVTLLALGVDRVLEWRSKAMQGRSNTMHPRVAGKILPRSGSVPERCLDLTSGYTAALTERWYPGPQENTLASLPAGLQTLAGTPFDLRGIVQLAGGEISSYGADSYPRRIQALPVERWVERLHFLHGTLSEVSDGQVIGRYRIDYNTTRSLEVPIVFGSNLRALWQPKSGDGAVTNAVVAWRGQNSATQPRDLELRLYKFTWENPWPAEEIVAVEFSSAGGNSAPFLVALTADDAPVSSEQKNASVDLVSAIQKAAPSFPVLPVGLQAFATHPVKLFANPTVIGGRFYDGFRFKTPEKQTMDMVWTFSPKGSGYRGWFILPMTGGLKVGFEDWFHATSIRRKDADVPSPDFVVQFLSGRKLQPGCEYLIWFGSDTNRPIEFQVGLKFLPSRSVNPHNPADLLLALGMQDNGEHSFHRHYCLGAIR